MSDKMDMIRQSALSRMRRRAAWLLCVIVCVWVSGCRRESPPGTPVPAVPARADLPAEPSGSGALAAASTTPDTAPDADPPSKSSEPPASNVFTILSSEPIPIGATHGANEGESFQMTTIEAGIVRSASDEPTADAVPTGQRRRRAGKGNPGRDPLEEIEEELVSKWNAIQSLASTLKTSTHSKTNDYELTTEGSGTRDSMRKGGKTLVRTVLGIGIKIEVEDEEIPFRYTGQRVLKVFDGEYLYTQIVTHEGATATKQVLTPQSFMAVGGPGLIAVLRSARKLYRKPDGKIDGRSMYVFAGYSPPTVRVEYMIDQETGLLCSVRREWEDADRTRSFDFVKHAINSGFPENHFTFTPEEGVEVEDRTGASTVAPATDPQP